MITVQALLDTDSLGLKGIAGLAGTHRLITWAHAVDAVTQVLSMERNALLEQAERDAVDGKGDPAMLRDADKTP